MTPNTPAATSAGADAGDDAPGVRLPWESMEAEEGGVATATPDAAQQDAVQDAQEAGEQAGEDVDAVDYESPLPAEPVEDDLGPAPCGGGWTLALLCFGIGIIACAVLIPQADANRRLVYEREKLRLDLESIRKQVATNDEFLRRVADDPNLAERLAQRQMKIIRQGTRVLELKGNARRESRAGAGAGVPLAASAGLSPDEMSPFHLVHVAPPPPMPPYEPAGGVLAGLFYHPRSRLYLIGTGLFLMAVGLVLGFGVKE